MSKFSNGFVADDIVIVGDWSGTSTGNGDGSRWLQSPLFTFWLGGCWGRVGGSFRDAAVKGYDMEDDELFPG